MKAVEFAKLKHGEQRRKYTGEPYWYHLEEVACLVSRLPYPFEEVAWLHDVLEDTDCTFQEVKDLYGNTVAEAVLYLSDLTPHSEGNREYRKNKYKNFLATCRSEIQTVKVADMISNTVSIKKYDPNFAKVYLREKAEMLDVLTLADPVLLRIAKGMI